MELQTQGQREQARAEFARLIADFPDYVPTYLMAGGNLRELGELEQAASIYRQGIEVATRRGDSHARRELESALAEVAPA